MNRVYRDTAVQVSSVADAIEQALETGSSPDLSAVWLLGDIVSRLRMLAPRDERLRLIVVALSHLLDDLLVKDYGRLGWYWCMLRDAEDILGSLEVQNGRVLWKDGG